MTIATRAGFESVFRAHYSLLCSYANQFLKDPDGAEEVVQEVMFRLWTNRSSLVIETSLRSYLFRAVRNGCMNVLKHRNVRDEYRNWREHQDQSTTLTQEDNLVVSELESRIREAIDRLPVERRKVFVHSRYDGLSYNQIAEKLGISVKTVENQMGKALKALREELAEYLPLIMVCCLSWFRGEHFF